MKKLTWAYFTTTCCWSGDHNLCNPLRPANKIRVADIEHFSKNVNLSLSVWVRVSSDTGLNPWSLR
jgi:hypothetical protein